jgi:hypothetical protein
MPAKANGEWSGWKRRVSALEVNVGEGQRRVKKCLGPDSNRHGVSPKGFSYHYSFRCGIHRRCVCGLDFTFAVP